MNKVSWEMSRLTRHIVEEEVGASHESVQAGGGATESQSEADRPVDQGADAHVQPVLDQNVDSVLGPVGWENEKRN